MKMFLFTTSVRLIDLEIRSVVNSQLLVSLISCTSLVAYWKCRWYKRGSIVRGIHEIGPGAQHVWCNLFCENREFWLG